ncbi:unnamed protein product [Rotaria magnacalcarata]
MFVLINETTRQRFNLNFSKTLPSQHLHPKINHISPSDDPYRLCESVYLSVDPDTYRLRSIAYPVLVPDLSVDFVLGSLFFDELNLKWSSSLKRLITRSEEEEEARRQTYRRILYGESHRRGSKICFAFLSF